ncbi:nuclear hormone receptor family member nhr-98-like [Eriocheir sinensis]|uniref:nuclear hormone receptor family member nhr-98-like n=1 Tax=Eriocheir sinensis TaxID=95602 RepID=UPI0021CA5021|nr:nuclear hormone receptor family member nhr-98-like [Eriocheir sinensis]
MPTPGSQQSSCVVCEVGPTPTPRNGVPTCRSCREFFRRHSLANQPAAPCSRSGNCRVIRNSRNSCVSCRLRRCIDAGLRIDNPGSSSQDADDDEVCAACNQINRAKHTIVRSMQSRLTFDLRVSPDARLNSCPPGTATVACVPLP